MTTLTKENKMEKEVEIVEDKKTFKEILKEQTSNIVLGIATLALSGWVAYDNHKRNNRKEQEYYGYLESKLELQESALSAYKDSLHSDLYDEKEVE